ncbi:uncharacterized protein [Canis lupus baileyi]|uniref:uncharacterized protein n=1 Tax=Canis lupus baileyi TaxID=143281 RepID=UPI0018F4A041
MATGPFRAGGTGEGVGEGETLSQLPPPPPPPQGVWKGSRRACRRVRAALLTTVRQGKAAAPESDPRSLTLRRVLGQKRYGLSKRSPPTPPPARSRQPPLRALTPLAATVAATCARTLLALSCFPRGLHQLASNCICSTRPARAGFHPNGSRARARGLLAPLSPRSRETLVIERPSSRICPRRQTSRCQLRGGSCGAAPGAGEPRPDWQTCQSVTPSRKQVEALPVGSTEVSSLRSSLQACFQRSLPGPLTLSGARPECRALSLSPRCRPDLQKEPWRWDVWITPLRRCAEANRHPSPAPHPELGEKFEE